MLIIIFVQGYEFLFSVRIFECANRGCSDHISSLLTVPPQMLHQSILILCEVVRINELCTPLDLVVIVIKCFSLNVLIFTSKDFVSNVQIDCSLLIGYRLYIPLDLVVVIALADSAPP